jgi:N-acetylglucosamine-6-phosphate deacetylase
VLSGADGEGLRAVPGFVDLQVNGAAGIHLTDRPEGLWEVAAALPRHGVTSFLPTAVTAPAATYERALAALADGPPPGWRGARPLGWHFEGPMLNPRRPGAHPPEHMRPPSAEVVAGWSRAAGVAMVTLAPELPGATAIIEALADRGVLVAAGHSEASAEQMEAAVAAGIRYATHLFTAMGRLHHRDPGVAGAVLSGLPIAAGLIVDGVHVDRRMVALAWRALGPERCSLVSDAMAGLGMPAGDLRLGAARVRVGEAGAARLADGTLAGGLVALDGCLRNLVAFTGCAPEEAVATVTRVPAGLLGRPELAEGVADAVLLGPELEVVATTVGGEVLHDRRAREGRPSRS